MIMGNKPARSDHLNDVIGFLLGHKPALFVSEKEKEAHLCKDYPFVSSVEFPAIPAGSLIFFQKEEQKQACIAKYQTQLITTYGPAYHRCLGEMLGLPPLAIEFFLRKDELEDMIKEKEPISDQVVKEWTTLKRNHAGCNYCGVRFSFNIAELEEIVEWMWGTYGDVKLDIVEVEFIRQRFHLPFGDPNKLQQIQKTVLEMAKLRSFDDLEMRTIYHSLKHVLATPELHQMHGDVREILRTHY
jgi:hypothetical protein